MIKNKIKKLLILIVSTTIFSIITINNSLVYANNYALNESELASIQKNHLPKNLTSVLANSTFNAINQNKQEINKNPNILKEIVADKLIEHVNIPYIGAIILGNHYRMISKENIEAFNTVLKDYIITSYAQILTLYNGQQISIGNEKYNSNKKEFATVTVTIKQNIPLNIDFKWRKNTRTGQWQVYDLISEGVSLINAKSSEWVPILRRKSIQVLIDDIKQQSKLNIQLSK